MKPDKEKEKEWGRFAEQMAAEHMLLEGYIIRERNWRPKHSHLEVDIICQKGDTIIFVEVKARHDPDYDPAEAVDSSKINRLIRAAEIYLEIAERYFEYRFDIISISGNEESFSLEHIPDAFLPGVSRR